jgi:hypothetical protein
LPKKQPYAIRLCQHLIVSSIAMEKALIDHKLKEKLEELKNKPFDWKWSPKTSA